MSAAPATLALLRHRSVAVALPLLVGCQLWKHHRSCIAVLVAALALQKIRGNASIACCLRHDNSTALPLMAWCWQHKRHWVASLLLSSGHLCFYPQDNNANKVGQGKGGGPTLLSVGGARQQQPPSNKGNKRGWWLAKIALAIQSGATRKWDGRQWSGLG